MLTSSCISKLQDFRLGSGTDDDPYIVHWQTYDFWNPRQYAASRKWFITLIAGISTFVVAFCTSAYSSGGPSITTEFNVSDEIVTLGLSLFILGCNLPLRTFLDQAELR
jgi:hypothetical protein